MTEPAQEAPDTPKRDLDAAIALCDGDVRAALRAVVVYNQFLEHELETVRAMGIGRVHARQASPSRAASKKLDDWRE
jgi:hypothetical protein